LKNLILFLEQQEGKTKEGKIKRTFSFTPPSTLCCENSLEKMIEKSINPKNQRKSKQTQSQSSPTMLDPKNLLLNRPPLIMF